MKKRAPDDGRSLFDGVDLEQETTEVGHQMGPLSPGLTETEPFTLDHLSDWREVPQPLFLSWSRARQLAYCEARDLDAATTVATTLAEAEWYVSRAASYKEMRS